MSDHDLEPEVDWPRLFAFAYEHQLRREAERQDPTRYRDPVGNLIPESVVRLNDARLYERYLDLKRTSVPFIRSPHEMLTNLMMVKHPRQCSCAAHALVREAVRRGDLG